MPDQGMHPTALSDFYDQRYAGDYMDTDAYSLWGHGDLRTRQVLETLRRAPARADAILDYGCGVGGWIGVIARVYPDAEISGVDVSGTAIEKAKLKYTGYRFMSFDGVTAPFQDGEFDLIFSYHVLEHVHDFEASARDIARMLKAGGHAIIIYPCGNKGSFLDRMMNLIEDAWRPTADGQKVLAFEMSDGHARRMTSQETIAVFRQQGLDIVAEYYSGHLFGTLDWLCRGTGPAYINKVFAGKPKGAWAKLRLDLTRRALVATHRLIQKQSLDVAKKRNPVKQSAVHAVRWLARLVDRLLVQLGAIEWRYLKSRKNGTAQYLVFRKA